MADLCPHCGEPVANGLVVPHIVDTCLVEQRLWHWECWQREVIGGVNHLRGTCTCCGGNEPPDPPELTRREAAKAAVAMYYGGCDAGGDD